MKRSLIPAKTVARGLLKGWATPGKWADALAAGEQELRRALTYGFSQGELDEQIANYRKALEVAVQTAPTRRTRSLANAITGSFNSERVFTTPQSALDRFEAAFPDITLDEIQDAFVCLYGFRNARKSCV